MTDYSRRTFLKTAGMAASTLAASVGFAEAEQATGKTAEPAPAMGGAGDLYATRSPADRSS